MGMITRGLAINDLHELLRKQDEIVGGSIGIADFDDMAVRALLLDMLQDEIDELRVKWGVKAVGNDGK